MHLNCTLLNIQYLISKRTNKLESQELKQFFQNNDIVLLTETWSDEYYDLTFPDFKVLSLIRDNRNINAKQNSGGIAIYM